MPRTDVAVACFVCLLASASFASAQLLVAKEGPIVYGHHHLNTTNVDAQKKFFVDTLGGKAIKIGTNNTEVIEFPNVLIFFRQQAPTGGTRGTTANHIGFSVPNLRQAVDKVKANGYRMITREEAAGRDVKDDIAGPTTPGGASIAFALGPDDVKVELVESRTQTMPIALHHVHFFNPQNADMQAWYVKVFGAQPGPAGGPFLSARLPGVALNFSPSTEPGRRYARPRARSHRLRSEEPRGVLPDARSAGHQAGAPVYQGRRAGHRGRLHQGSVGHVHRADGGPG